jgi:glycerophosphoryl diester phosphodiesterase
MTNARYVRVGHKGAAALAPENTIASLGAALAYGVDMVEFDVVDAADGTLVLAHSREEIEPDAATLDDALAFLAAEAPPGAGLDLDLKAVGVEEAVAGALRRHGLLERALVCSFFPMSLRKIRALEPGLRTGISYPWDRRGLSERAVFKPVVPLGAAALRSALPLRIGGMVRGAAASSAMLHFSVVSAASVRRCHALGITVFAWTVDDPALLERMLACGVDGVISNDPRIFDAVGEPLYDRCRQ